MDEKKACCIPQASQAPITLGVKRSGVPATKIDQAAAPANLTDMAQIPGGVFLMGNETSFAFAGDGEGPVRPVKLSSFAIDKYAVSNEKFAAFVDATGFITEAERLGWSFVFQGSLPKNRLKSLQGNLVVETQWWVAVPGARWNRPAGERSSIKGMMNHPVVHVSWNDAIEYAKWAGKSLPTEAQWEYASRGGLEQKTYPWGDDLTPMGKHRCNIWQGKFPAHNTAEDGFTGTGPVDSFAPNGYGLFNMTGNTWEWCLDWFSVTHHADLNRSSPALEDPKGPPLGAAKVMRGGSFLCHRSYCNRYRCAARTSSPADSGTEHLGFRCVVNGGV